MNAVYRNNIVQRMGGEPGFDFLVVTYCENILDDEGLDRFFANFDLKSLAYFQKELLLISFLEPCEETKARRKRVMFRNEMMGLDQSQFTVLEEHFIAALDDCFITGLDFELCKAYFAELRPVFKECTMVSKYRENIVDRMGGEATFDLLVASYCEKIEGDTKLHRFFQGHDLHSMTHLQKELILMAFLQPSAENNVEDLKRRVNSRFSRMFALGMNADHFEMMENHFTAALYTCLSRPAIIEICCKLFSNLISFFEENAQSPVCNDDDDESDDESDEESIVLSKERMPSHIAKKISAALNVSERTSVLTADTANESSCSSIRSLKSFDSGPRTSSLRSSAKPEKRHTSTTSIGFTSPLASTPKRKMGRPKMFFSWKSPSFKGRKSATMKN